MSKIITIYDSDAIAYRAAAVVDTRSVEVQHNKSKRTKVFKTRTEFKEFLKNKDMEFVKDDYTFTDKVEAGDLGTCIGIMKNQIEKINSDLFADEMLMCIQGKSNWRDSLPLPSKYKGSRVNTIRPTYLREAKTYLYKNYPSIVAQNCEVDDVVIYKGYEYLNKGYTPIIIGVDKDAKAYSGLSLYDYTSDAPEVQQVPDFGSLWFNAYNKLKGDGFIWYCAQILMGDDSDDYKPCELAGVKFGDKSAYKVLENCTTKQDALQQVISQYKAWYPTPVKYTAWDGSEHVKNYLEILDMYHQCARMIETEGELPDVRKFLDKHGVELT